MRFDPYAPCGPVVTSTFRVVTRNVWGATPPTAKQQISDHYGLAADPRY